MLWQDLSAVKIWRSTMRSVLILRSGLSSPAGASPSSSSMLSGKSRFYASHTTGPASNSFISEDLGAAGFSWRVPDSASANSLEREKLPDANIRQ